MRAAAHRVSGILNSLSVLHRQRRIEAGDERPQFRRIGFERRGHAMLAQRAGTHWPDRRYDQAIQLTRKFRSPP